MLTEWISLDPTLPESGRIDSHISRNDSYLLTFSSKKMLKIVFSIIISLELNILKLIHISCIQNNLNLLGCQSNRISHLVSSVFIVFVKFLLSSIERAF